MEPRQWFDFSTNLGKRILSALVLAPIALGILFVGGVIYQVTILLVSLLILTEWQQMLTSRISIWEESKIKKWRYMGVLYAFVFAASMLYLRAQEHGVALVLFTCMIVWSTDIAAFAAGRMIGGAKILPSVSPNKTWAGLGGGVLAAAMIGLVSSFFAKSENHLALAFFGVLLGAILAVIEQAGDFFESWVKRQCEAKDSGDLIPGHGGVMDRLDGFVTVSFVVALISVVNGGKVFS